jgi:hypothetical protein
VKPVLRYIYFLIVFLPLSAAALDSDWQFDGVGRVVAISDIHGAYDAMLRTLGNAGVVDAELDWAGGETHLVIVGDILDRGPDSRAAMDLLMKLEPQAAEAGGRVHVLIGNHEAMNLSGDLRYVSTEEYAAFASDETSEERAHWQQIYTARAEASGNTLTDEEFAQQYPAGFFAHRRAFRADGQYGKWLLSKPVMVVINRVAYVHAGLSPAMSRFGLDDVNRGMVGELRAYVEHVATLVDAGVFSHSDNSNDHEEILDKHMPALDESPAVLEAVKKLRRLQDSALFDLDGPLWYRGNVSCARVIEEHRLTKTLASLGADRVVIGHTPTFGRQVLQRFAGRIIEVDTGMLNSYYDGTGNALVLEGDDISVVTEQGDVLVEPPQHPRRVGFRPNTMSAEDIAELLAHGEIIGENEVEQTRTARTILDISDGNQTVQALFLKSRSKNVNADIAAYRLDQFLELGMVPVTVARKFGKVDGSVQFLPSKITNEKVRSASGRGGAAWCPLSDQWEAMYVFDVLILNEDRTFARMLYNLENWQLMLIEHRRAFASKSGRPAHLKSAPIKVNQGWREKLKQLDAKTIDELFADVLDKSRRRALLVRRNELLLD